MPPIWDREGRGWGEREREGKYVERQSEKYRGERERERERKREGKREDRKKTQG